MTVCADISSMLSHDDIHPHTHTSIYIYIYVGGWVCGCVYVSLLSQEALHPTTSRKLKTNKSPLAVQHNITQMQRNNSAMHHCR